MRCPVCAAPLPYCVEKHIKACREIEMALLQAEITPAVVEKPRDWKWV